MHLEEGAQLSEADAGRELVQLEEKSRQKNKNITQKQLLQLLSSVGPPEQVVLKNTSRRDSAPTPWGDPKPLSQEPPYRDRNLKGQDTNKLSVSPVNSEL